MGAASTETRPATTRETSRRAAAAAEPSESGCWAEVIGHPRVATGPHGRLERDAAEDLEPQLAGHGLATAGAEQVVLRCRNGGR